jgi:hypothetical protein
MLPQFTTPRNPSITLTPTNTKQRLQFTSPPRPPVLHYNRRCPQLLHWSSKELLCPELLNH